MNQNVIIGILVVIVLLAGGYYFLNMNTAPAGTDGSTTTPSSVTVTDNTPVNQPPVAGVPDVTTDASVAPTNSTAVVSGKVTPNGAQTTYWYEYGTSATLGSKTASQTVGSGWTAIPSPGYITGLSANGVYYFRLSAKNAFGTVNGATNSFSTNNNPPGQGNSPAATTNSASDVTRTAATLRASVNARSSQTTYWFEFGTSADFGQLTSFQSAGSANASVSVTAAVSGLTPQTKYYFRVDAQNQYGTVNGTTQSFTTSGPAVAAAPVVTTLPASPAATTTATLRGTVNPSGAQTTYWFEYSTDSLLGSVLLKSTTHRSAGAAQATASVQADVSSLQPNTQYYFRTVAQNAAGTVRGDNQTFTTK